MTEGSAAGPKVLGFKDILFKYSLLPFICSRLFVIGALVASKIIVNKTHPTYSRTLLVNKQGMFSWDAGYYKLIGSTGYGLKSSSVLRFFPLDPLIAHVGSTISGINAGDWMILISNVATLLASVLIFRLAKSVLPLEVAKNAIWIFFLQPASFVFVMGYSDSTYVFLECAILLLLMRKNPNIFWLFAIGYLAGLTRPTGILLAAPIVWVGLFGNGKISFSFNPVRLFKFLFASTGAVFGMLTYLIWVKIRFGDMWLPLSIQTSSGHRGAFSDPFTDIYSNALGIFHGHIGEALHTPWIFLAVLLVVVTWVKLPSYWAFFVTVTLVAVLISHNLDGFERYIGDLVPFMIAASLLITRSKIKGLLLGAGGMIAFLYAELAFLGLYIP
ncbi:MAG: hypothetical protein HKL80_09085 [Acidimicrobiales bacterium]|nr:hypothetical protein [Acidimicrobiales bacterium]